MTLILSYLCQDYAVQVSDRRLVVPKPGGGYATYEEAANKALLWKPTMAFSYTGLARMGRQRGRPTDELLLEPFASGVQKGLDGELQRLCRNASKACREMNLEGQSPSMRQKLRRTSFVGVGYRRSSSGPGLVPTMCLVSNAQSIHEDGWRDRADKEFAITTMELPPGGEVAAVLITEAEVRLLPGVLGNEASAVDDSFAAARQGEALEGPVYTVRLRGVGWMCQTSCLPATMGQSPGGGRSSLGSVRRLCGRISSSRRLVAMTEQQSYQVLDTVGDVELRHYDRCVVAEVVVEGSAEQAGSAAFQPLFRYISGANQATTPLDMTAPVLQQPNPEKLAMTAPVLQQQEATQKWTVAFVLPGDRPLAEYPIPTDSRVQLREVSAQTAAALRWSGRWTRANTTRRTDQLRHAITAAGWQESGEPQWARYNAPWTPPFARRNEIIIPVELPTADPDDH